MSEWGLPMVTENTITEKSELLEELEEIRERGYATDIEERTEGLCCVAAPVLLHNEVLGAISVSAPISRFEGANFDDEIIREIKSRADGIALDIRYRDSDTVDS
jgi:DNA-binding IclR family transcriptional regulator